MGALSTKDKLTLKLSAAKVERWNRERCKPAVNFTVSATGKVKPVERCRVVFAHGQEKPEESVVPDKTAATHALSDGHKMRLPCGKLTLLRRGDNFSDYHDSDYSESPRDPAWKNGQPTVAKARPDSPFKRAGKSAASVVIVRK
jgi:hypothetical protein